MTISTNKIPTLTKFYIHKFMNYIDRKSKDECWTWKGATNTDGYGYFRIKDKIYRAHRLSYNLKHGRLPEKKLICHRCDNRHCVNPHHLYAGTHRDNSMDMVNKGRHVSQVQPEALARGSHNGMAKLKEQDVFEIRALSSVHKYKYFTIAKLYDVSASTIGRILVGQTWCHI